MSEPSACRWCGIPQREHARRWAKPAGWHKWEQPTQAQIKQRMWSRRAARLNAEPAKYHTTTAWAPDHTGESADPYCADCKTDVCHRWSRIQARLDQIRWGIPRRTKHPLHATTSGWGSDNPNLPF